MSSDHLSDARIVDSWHKNASPWTDAVRSNQIASRALVTNRAIIDAVMSRSPRTVLDIGCGEGWLVRALSEAGVKATGVDVVPTLIEQANTAGGGEFRVASYEQIAAGELDTTVDVVVANFSLIGRESVEGVVQSTPALLAEKGALIIQTLHPLVAGGDLPYEDGWRRGSWAGFSDEFTDPAPWYFRTLESWKSLLADSGFSRIEMREPIHPETGNPASVIFIAEDHN
ncbi:MAG TPA: methyltransferase domain-containing protein [Gemmatimonadaceae bacterium]|nr:methyltransferase domain-containing protein [Gemmatimonadaceae bacterium]